MPSGERKYDGAQKVAIIERMLKEHLGIDSKPVRNILQTNLRLGTFAATALLALGRTWNLCEFQQSCNLELMPQLPDYLRFLFCCSSFKTAGRPAMPTKEHEKDLFAENQQLRMELDYRKS